MTKEELARVFADAVEKVYSPETREKAKEKLRHEQHFGNTSEDEILLAINTELALNRQLLFEVLEKTLCSE